MDVHRSCCWWFQIWIRMRWWLWSKDAMRDRETGWVTVMSQWDSDGWISGWWLGHSVNPLGAQSLMWSVTNQGDAGLGRGHFGESSTVLHWACGLPLSYACFVSWISVVLVAVTEHNFFCRRHDVAGENKMAFQRNPMGLWIYGVVEQKHQSSEFSCRPTVLLIVAETRISNQESTKTEASYCSYEATCQHPPASNRWQLRRTSIISIQGKAPMGSPFSRPIQ